ncbi:hypothetical protein E1A91_D11G083500v1 [Gossypium mustelinum]|uniref:Uncharacterized protein n=3 Tax=Gossypium TaxID=3633 RepID=A0A5J5P8E6_GOSBA|nr:hypothetical protein ES319_D11G081000v1 [Gossypium barbadense]TYG44260.1 hypothetical protein ES288_D11G083900v1 [Gossypium darwinii]TYI54563.1 hypothetical protein E1A91_D11G083500v1 [Gossypium mustelinum]
MLQTLFFDQVWTSFYCYYQKLTDKIKRRRSSAMDLQPSVFPTVSTGMKVVLLDPFQ